ncbi:DJ-1/PfpI family protein [Rhizobium viscosum]|uniref:Cyclohexyl-isocyanide hydratase n=1 Tax=Rhizobium viscosum TaxID=1673 RepID=A0ABR9IXJ6_RHIVS|nr:DJ-1/PfpI family protein [Rhizobium viscosum]MBE1507934.1 cyclohexyl-isocyanide hydratase [Rhizobium viscosum]
MILGIPVYDHVDLLDVAAPHEVLKWMDPDLEIRLLAGSSDRPAVTRDGFRFIPTHPLSDRTPIDILWVPGGDPPALAALMNGLDGGHYLDYLQQVGSRATWVCSVCEGALLSAAAGLLDGYEATTHWAFLPCLKKFNKITVVSGFPRFHLDGNRLTGGGISSGLDESLELVRLLTDDETVRKVQQTLQYYPKPPFPENLREPPQCMFDW